MKFLFLRHLLIVCPVLLFIASAEARETTEKNIYITEARGVELLQTSTHKSDFFRLSTTLVTQQTQSMCSVASSVTVLNALLPATARPQAPIYFPYRYYTQESFFTDAVNKTASMQEVLSQGMTLQQIETSLRGNNVQAELTYASDSSANNFRVLLKKDLRDVDSYIIVNFDRRGVHQDGGGHFSPIAAYHEETDRVFILDVARYKYAPVWVRLEDLFTAMDSLDEVSRKSRGWVRVTQDLK